MANHYCVVKDTTMREYGRVTKDFNRWRTIFANNPDEFPFSNEKVLQNTKQATDFLRPISLRHHDASLLTIQEQCLVGNLKDKYMVYAGVLLQGVRDNIQEESFLELYAEHLRLKKASTALWKKNFPTAWRERRGLCDLMSETASELVEKCFSPSKRKASPHEDEPPSKVGPC